VYKQKIYICLKNSSSMKIEDLKKLMFMPGLDYTHTNESLDAIIAGLAINTGDIILAVGGSGDQAFAMLEYAKSVIVVDKNKHQIDYIAKRIELIKKGFYNRSLRIGELGTDDGMCRGTRDYEFMKFNIEKRNRYFLQKGRLDRIRENLGFISLVNADIFSVLGSGNQTKLYLSSAEPLFLKNLDSLDLDIQKYELVYVTLPSMRTEIDPMRFKNIAKDLSLTVKASDLQKNKWELWEPAVYRPLKS